MAISLCLTLRLCQNILSVCFFINIIDIITKKKYPWSSLYMFTPPMDFDIFNENQMLRYKGFSLYINLIQFYKSVPISSIIIRWLFYNNFHFHFCIFPCFDITVWHNSCDICHANVQYYSRTNFAPLHYGL